LSSFRVCRRRFAAGYAATDDYDTGKSLLSACNLLRSPAVARLLNLGTTTQWRCFLLR
jgi:hypothetical protein